MKFTGLAKTVDADDKDWDPLPDPLPFLLGGRRDL